MPSLYPAEHEYPKKRRWHIIQSLFFIFILSLAAFIFLQSSFFKVQEIIVNGNKQFKKEEIVVLSGLQKGINMFKANLKLAESKVALHPAVKQVRISRDLPATVIISLTERKAVGLVAGHGSFIVMSEDGYYLSKVNNLGDINLPIITGIEPGSAGPGQKIADERLKAALDYLLTMPLNIRAAVSEINVSDLNNIRMFTIDKAEVRFGDKERIDEKIRLYQEVINQKYQDRIQYIDISYKGNPVIRFIEPPEQEKQLEP